MENEGGTRETLPVTPEMPAEAIAGPRERLSDVEKPVEAAVAETGAEKVTVALPPLVASVMSDDGVSDAPSVRKDAERMPKEYAKHLVEVMRKYKKDPNELQKNVTSLKWDYMGKAFGRKLGDGLDGRGKD